MPRISPHLSHIAIAPGDIPVIEDSVDRLLVYAPELTAGVFTRLLVAFPGIEVGHVQRSQLECALMSLLGMVASELRHPERVMPCLRGMAVRYLGRNFTARQLRSVRSAMISSVRQCLGLWFSGPIEAAWYGVSEALIARIMEDSRAISAPSVKLRLVS